MADFAKIAKEIFQILHTFDYTVSMYNQDKMNVVEPEEARWFYAKPANLMVSIIDDDDNSHVNLLYGKSTHASDVMGLIETLREACTKYALTFRAQQHGKEIEPKDFSDLASISERKQNMMTPLTEGMYGTTKSSYLRMENARMIVRHSKRIDDSVIGARGRCVEQIFIENASGERLLFPSTSIAPARAMTQHVSQGGNFTDDIGGQIMQMTNEYANLGQASSFVANHASSLQEGAMAVREACRTNMRKLRKTFERLSKATSYGKESARIIEQAKMLAETGEKVVDETRISEIRQLLNDADLPRSVYECACKAMDKMRDEDPITEDDKEPAKVEPNAEEPEDAETDEPKPMGPTKSVLGRRVDTTAWEDLKLGKLALKNGQPPNIANMPKFRDRYAELCYKLGGILPMVSNESMQSLLQFVLDSIQDYTETGVAPFRAEDPNAPVVHGEPPRSKDRMGDWHKKFNNMLIIAGAALRAAHLPLNGELAENNAIVRKHIQWLNMFNPDLLLTENLSMDPYSTMNGMDLGDVHADVQNDAVKAFDPEEFVDSPEMIDIINGRNPEDPEENTLTHDEVMDALKSYLEHYITIYSGHFDDGFDSDTTDMAEEVFDRACEALQKKGFIVENHSNEELDEFADHDDNVLSIDDIMIPKPNQGDSLIKQVTKPMVKDPDTKGRRPPDSAYVDRLQALGWVTTGPNGQSY